MSAESRASAPRILRASMAPCDECGAGHAEEHLTTCSSYFRWEVPPCGCTDLQEISPGEYVPLHRQGCRARLSAVSGASAPEATVCPVCDESVAQWDVLACACLRPTGEEPRP